MASQAIASVPLDFYHYQKSESFRSRDTPVCGVLKVQQGMPKGIKLRTNYGKIMARSVRSKERVNYIALNSLSSADVEPVFTGKRKYKPGAKLCQV